jgi:hypothetical protein
MLNTRIKLNKTFFTVLAILIMSHFFAHALDKCINPSNVLSVVTSEWNNDASFDRAILASSGSESDETELFIYLSDSLKESMKLSVHKKNIAWRGGLWGTQPSLETNKRGSLIVISGNEAIGRDRWTQKLTIAYRNNVFLVVGYTYVAHDTLNPNYELNCDVNLFNGKGIKNGKRFRSSARAVAVIDWSKSSIPRECQLR